MGEYKEPGGRHGGPHLLAEKRKIGEKHKKEEFQIKTIKS